MMRESVCHVISFWYLASTELVGQWTLCSLFFVIPNILFVWAEFCSPFRGGLWSLMYACTAWPIWTSFGEEKVDYKTGDEFEKAFSAGSTTVQSNEPCWPLQEESTIALQIVILGSCLPPVLTSLFSHNSFMSLLVMYAHDLFSERNSVYRSCHYHWNLKQEWHYVLALHIRIANRLPWCYILQGSYCNSISVESILAFSRSCDDSTNDYSKKNMSVKNRYCITILLAGKFH